MYSKVLITVSKEFHQKLLMIFQNIFALPNVWRSFFTYKMFEDLKIILILFFSIGYSKGSNLWVFLIKYKCRDTKTSSVYLFSVIVSVQGGGYAPHSQYLDFHNHFHNIQRLFDVLRNFPLGNIRKVSKLHRMIA